MSETAYHKIISDQRRAAAEQRAAEQEARIARMGHTIDGLIRERDAAETALTEIIRLYEIEPTRDAQEAAGRMHRVAVDALTGGERARAGERAVLEAADDLLTNLDLDPAALAALRASDQTGEIIETVERLRGAMGATTGSGTESPVDGEGEAM